MEGSWVSIEDGVPDNYNDKKIKLSNNKEILGYYDVKSSTWCQGIGMPFKYCGYEGLEVI